MRFSQRIGLTNVRNALQIESIDSTLENRLWNNILNDFFSIISDYDSKGRITNKERICKIIWEDFFEQRTDDIPSYNNGGIYVKGVLDYIRNWFLRSEWYLQYDFIEFLADLNDKLIFGEFTAKTNETLKRESAGYRLIDNKIVQITSNEEVNEIEEAINGSNKLKSVKTHLITALEFLSNREQPDYRNSIKESISAVESFCIIMTGENDATLGKALGIIEEKYKIHGALKSAFSSLYGYTSDSGGIRHSLLEDDIEVTMEDAKFMLVSCSAFINYLKSKE